uniref:AAA+ ATPase domain-containing protein n=1 Tax=Sus scrofa TaxID=9823 RepID=A0A8D1LHP6_PIG
MTTQEKTEEPPFVDIFNEDEAEKNFILSKPVCFVVFGKPGVGKTTLAQQITQAWKCIHVEALPVLEEQMASETESGVMLQSMLISGQSIPDELVTKLILEKLNSPEVSHFGYIITEIPSLSQDAMTTLQQIELIKNLNLKPDIIINIKVRILSRQHQILNLLQARDQTCFLMVTSQAFLAEMQAVAEILQNIVQRPEDYLENIENMVKLYKDIMLHPLEEVMAEHDSQYLIELDGNQPPEELFMAVMDRFKYLNLKRAAILTKLQSAEEEISDTMENDELFRTLASYKLIAPRYRWRRSRWGRTCPVNLKEGNIFQGLPDFSVSFLGKIYCLSSEEALKTFLSNPRPYLLPPMPAPPFKVFIVGPQSSGKTTLSNLLAKHYKGKVVDYNKLVRPRFDKALEMLTKNTIAEATEAAIKTVKERLLTELQAKKQDVNIVLFTDEKETSETFALRSDEDSSRDVKLDSPKESAIEEVTADHPEVLSIIKETVQMAKSMNFEQPHEKYAEILDEVLQEVVEENKNRFYGAPKYGGWILDNFPTTRELWMALVDKGILPDLVICLLDTGNNGKYLLNRLYLENKPEIDSKILERLLDELLTKRKEEEEARKAKEEAMKIEEENRRLMEAMNVKAKGKHEII